MTIAHLELMLPPGAPSVRIARHEVEQVIADYPEDVRATVALLTSELASNAVVHAQTAFTIRAEADQSMVRVSVCDSGGQEPAIVTREATTKGGWGLSMVDAAATRWGIDADGTTTVWFEIDIDLR